MIVHSETLVEIPDSSDYYNISWIGKIGSAIVSWHVKFILHN